MGRYSRLKVAEPPTSKGKHGSNVRATPSLNQLILGKPRWEWIVDCARTLIAATDPAMRYLIRRDGRHVFMERSRIPFAEDSPVALTSDERGRVYDYLMHYINVLGFVRWNVNTGHIQTCDKNQVKIRIPGTVVATEHECQEAFDRAYERQRNKNPTAWVEEGPGDGSDIEVTDAHGRVTSSDEINQAIRRYRSVH